MIDLHSHILPQMDDGSASLEETSQLLTLLKQQGVTTVVATPHYRPTLETPQDFLTRREEAAKQLETLSGAHPDILLGAEVAYFAGIGGCEDIIPLQLGDSKLLLVEMPFTPWSERMIRDVCDIGSRLGLIPVLAHVNRYRRRQQLPKYLSQLTEGGVLLQCNAEVFSELTGKRWAISMLKKGRIHFLGSDCHNMQNRQPQMDVAYRFIEKKLGSNFLDRFQENISMFFSQKKTDSA